MPTLDDILPELAPDVVVRPLDDQGRHVVKNPRKQSYLKLGEQESFLLLALDGLSASLERAVAASEPSLVADRLLEIASLFSSLYSNRQWKVLSDDAELSDARMALALAARQALVNGLGWLGVPVPDRM